MVIFEKERRIESVKQREGKKVRGKEKRGV
jgi:hypothetical protein